MPHLTEVAPGVLVATADYDTTTTTVVTAPGRDCLVIDPAVTVADLSALAAELAGAGLRPRAGFATHPHWDHVLWSRELGAVPRYAAPAALVVTTGQRAEMIAAVEQAAPGHDLALFADLVALPGDAAHIPWPGPAAQVIAHGGHAPGHAAVFLPIRGCW